MGFVRVGCVIHKSTLCALLLALTPTFSALEVAPLKWGGLIAWERNLQSITPHL